MGFVVGDRYTAVSIVTRALKSGSIESGSIASDESNALPSGQCTSRLPGLMGADRS